MPSDFQELLKDYETNVDRSSDERKYFSPSKNKIEGKKGKPFDTSIFNEELREKSEVKNKNFSKFSKNINAYSISSECICAVIMKILGYPIKSFADKWLPLVMRGTIGSAIHDVIQDNTKQFTEVECSMKVPSIRFSGRIDGIIGNNILCEIKSCTYSDYEWIIKNQAPRKADFYQLIAYKYIIENYLKEIQNGESKLRTPPPKLDKYEIDTIQFIYVAHDLCSADVDSIKDAFYIVDHTKKMFKSKYNQFYFMTSLVLDTNCFNVEKYIGFVKEKIELINYYVEHNKLPTESDKYIDKKKCFFCMYKDSCHIIGK